MSKNFVFRILSILFFLIGKFISSGCQTICDFPDIQVYPSSDMQSEVHLSINPIDSNNLILSCNTYLNNHYSQGYFYTFNAGNTWGGNENFPNDSIVGGDPSSAFDGINHGYLSTLIPNLNGPLSNGIYMESSNNGGQNWNTISNATSNSGTDKEMIATDYSNSSKYKNTLYTSWTTSVGNSSKEGEVNYSDNGGGTFSLPITLNRYALGVNVQVDPLGNVYDVWADYGTISQYSFPASGIGLSISNNGGQTFSNPVIAFLDTGIAIYKNAPDPRFNKIGINDLPSMDIDRSDLHNGRIYIVYPEEINNKSVIVLRYSDTQGSFWSGSEIISNQSFTQSFFPWIAVDNINGDIYIAYYAFDQPSGYTTDTYVAYSNNGGNSFQTIKVSDVSFTTQPINNNKLRQGYMGDYIGIVAHGGKGWASWSDNRSGQWQIYVSQVATNSTPGVPSPTLESGFDNWYCSYSSQSFYTFSYRNAVSYTWTTSGGLTINGNLSPFTTTDTLVTISGTTSKAGNVTIVANLSCGGFTLPSSSLYFSGQPNFTPTYKVFCPSNPNNTDSTTAPYIAAGPLTVYFYSAPSNLRISGYRWYIDGSTSYLQTSTNNLPYPTTGTHTVSVSINTQCGWTPQTLWQQVTLCGSSPTMTTYIETTASLKSKGRLSKNEKYLIYPNPVNSSLQIEDKKGDPLGLIKFYDSQGKLIKQIQTGSSYISMPLYNLADGLYILKIVNKNLIPFTKKIIISK